MISIIIPFAGETQQLSSTLRSLCSSNVLRDSEILIVCTNDLLIADAKYVSDSLISNLVLGWTVRFFDGKGSFPGRARNIGIENARNDILFFIDTGMDLESFPDGVWLESISPNRLYLGLCSFSIKKIDMSTLFYAAYTYGIDGRRFISSASVILKSTLVNSNTRYREDLRTCEDTEFLKEISGRSIALVESNDLVVSYSSFPSGFKKVIEKVASNEVLLCENKMYPLPRYFYYLIIVPVIFGSMFLANAHGLTLLVIALRTWISLDSKSKISGIKKLGLLPLASPYFFIFDLARTMSVYRSGIRYLLNR